MQPNDDDRRSLVSELNATEILFWGPTDAAYEGWAFQSRPVRALCLPSLRLLDLSMLGTPGLGQGVFFDILRGAARQLIYRQRLPEASRIEIIRNDAPPSWIPAPRGYIRYLRFAVPYSAGPGDGFRAFRTDPGSVTPRILAQHSFEA
jgi:hypothetical protein